MGRRAAAFVLVLESLSCGGDMGTSSPTETAVGAGSASSGSSTTARSTATTTAAAPPDAPPRGSLSVRGLEARVGLEHAEVTGDGDPSTDVTARLSGLVRLVNRSAAPITVSDPIQLPSSYDWEIRDASGTRWRMMFLPPPMPPAGGIPMRNVTIAPGAEAEWGWLGSVSGFYRDGAPPDLGVLPPSTYQLTIGNIAIGNGETLRAPPITFVVRTR